MPHLPNVPFRSRIVDPVLLRQRDNGGDRDEFAGHVLRDWVQWFLHLHQELGRYGYWADLGGARQVGDRGATWFIAPEWKEVVVRKSGSYTFRVQVRTADAGTSVTARIYDMTAGAAVTGGTGSASTSTSWTEEALSVVLMADSRYRLELLSGNQDADVFGVAQIEG